MLPSRMDFSSQGDMGNERTRNLGPSKLLRRLSNGPQVQARDGPELLTVLVSPSKVKHVLRWEVETSTKLAHDYQPIGCSECTFTKHDISMEVNMVDLEKLSSAVKDPLFNKSIS